METNKNDESNDKSKEFPRLQRFIDKLEDFVDDFVVPNSLEEVVGICFVLAIIIIAILLIAFFLPILIKVISLWWNLIL